MSFADDPSLTAMTALIERVQVLESKVNNLEPSLSTLQSSISSTPLDPPEGIKKGEGSINDPSSNSSLSHEIPLHRRIEALEAWMKSHIGGIPSNAQGFTMSELVKRITNLETQLTRLSVQELPNRQRELEVKMDRLLQTEELPSFGSSTSSKPPTSLELRFNKMEINQASLVSENEKLQARLSMLEESQSLTTIRALELPLFKGNKRVFVCDAIGKYVVIDRWFVSMITGKGSIIIDDPAPTDFPPGTSVRTIGPDDEWTMDENGRMILNGIPTNIHSDRRNDTPRETEVFQTPPPTPRQQPVEEEEDGVIYLSRILPGLAIGSVI